ncbi:MAG: O-antigen ligase family protein [Candidatus Nomurabacteria bacterium]|nr:MAG: O-antigen ligase family protein [Candidatus Nomurabacteria bacterium]
METIFPRLQHWINTQPKTLFISIATLGGLGILLSAASANGLAFALLLGGIAFWLALFRPHWLVFLLAAYIPFEPFVLKYVSDDLYVYIRYASELLIYLLVFAALVYRLRSRTHFSLGPNSWWLVFFFGSIIISIFMNSVPVATAILGTRQIIRFMLLGLAVVNLPLSKRFAKTILWMIIGIAALQSLIGLGQSLIGAPADNILIPSEERLFGSILLTPGTDQYWEGGQRITATMGRYDQLGTFLSFVLLLVVGLLYEHPKLQTKRKLLAILMLGIAALALTYSRASWFGFALGFGVISVFLKRDKRVMIAGFLLIAFVALYPFFTSLVVDDLIDQPNMPIVDRLYEAFSYERWRSEYYGQGRVFFIIETATKVFPAAPVFGFGPGQYGGGAAAALANTTVYDQLGIPFGIYGYTGQIDNNWLALLGETGAVGVLLYMALFLSIIRYSWRVYRQSEDKMIAGFALGLIGAILAAAFEGALGTHFEVRTLGVYLWLFPALLFVLHEKTSDYENRPSQ